MSLMRDRFKDAILAIDNDVKKWYHRNVEDVAAAVMAEAQKMLDEQKAELSKLIPKGSATLAEAIAKQSLPGAVPVTPKTV